MWKDVVDSLRLNWISRTSSPLFGALAISWLVWNHRLLLVLFADKPVTWRFMYVDSVLYPDIWRFALFNIVGPVASALVYLYAFPYPARRVFEFSLNRKQELNEIALKAEGKRLLTEEEAKAIRQQIDEGVAERIKLVEAHNETERSLRQANDVLAKQVREAQTEIVEEAARSIPLRPDEAIPRLHAYLLSRPFLLIFNFDAPRDRGAKKIMFGDGGVILMGNNNNEARWFINGNAQLQFVNSDGGIHSRFDFDAEKAVFRGAVLSNGQRQELHRTDMAQ